MVTWPMTSRDPERSNSWPQHAWSAISRKGLEMRLRSKGLPIGNGMGYQMSCDRWRHHHVTPKVLWGSTIGYPSDSLASCFFVVVRGQPVNCISMGGLQGQRTKLSMKRPIDCLLSLERLLLTWKNSIMKLSLTDHRDCSTPHQLSQKTRKPCCRKKIAWSRRCSV